MYILRVRSLRYYIPDKYDYKLNHIILNNRIKERSKLICVEEDFQRPS